jgi:hypothetical protein
MNSTTTKPKCIHCNKTLTKIHSPRKNGQSKPPPKEHILHKKCWIALKKEQDALLNMCIYIPDDEGKKAINQWKQRKGLKKLL